MITLLDHGTVGLTTIAPDCSTYRTHLFTVTGGADTDHDEPSTILTVGLPTGMDNGESCVLIFKSDVAAPTYANRKISFVTGFDVAGLDLSDQRLGGPGQNKTLMYTFVKVGSVFMGVRT